MLRDGASVSQHQCPVLCHSMVSLKFAQFSHSSLSHCALPFQVIALFRETELSISRVTLSIRT